MRQNAFFNPVNQKFYLEISKEQFDQIELNNKKLDPVSLMSDSDLESIGVPSLAEIRKQMGLKK